MSATHAAVVGSPIEHSLSPVLHEAAYAALGLTGWSYHRHEVRAGGLAAYVAGLTPDWVGLSVTMPGKEEALELADEAGPDALLVGAANTLIRVPGGWRAENTDIAGMEAALRESDVGAAQDADVIGSGATARSVLVALVRLGVQRVRFVVRDHARPGTVELAARLGLEVDAVRYDGWPAELADLVVSTVPGGATPAVDETPVRTGGLVFDVTYAPWPTPLAEAAGRHTPHVVGGGLLLLHQAAAQVELMTGREAPVEQMREALAGWIPQVGR